VSGTVDAGDSLGFLDAVVALPEQLDDAHRRAGAVPRDAFPPADGVRNIVVCGMGGSGIAGDVLAAAANNELPVPVVVLKQIRVPRFVGPDSLVFAVSYSGSTDETLSMARSAIEAGARVVGISLPGSPLAELVEENHGLALPCVDGIPAPRAAIGTLVAPIFVTLFRVGLLPSAHDALVSAHEQLARRRDACAPGVDAARNEAREIARRIGRTIPLAYGAGALGGVAAYRWKCDVNENAKAPAYSAQFPELDHNEICAWGQHGDVTRQLISLVELRHGFEHAQLEHRIAFTRDIVQEALHQVIEVRAAGTTRLAQLLDLMYQGDLATTYLALDAGIDPGPIEAIRVLKQRMAAAG
jgi:glucose/mannose-6-phosphate isomerase